MTDAPADNMIPEPEDNPTTEPTPERTDDDRKAEMAMHLAAINRLAAEIKPTTASVADNDPFAHIGGSAPLGETHTARDDPVVKQAIESFKAQVVERNAVNAVLGLSEMMGEWFGIVIPG